jgi:hypothetical protein
MVEESKENSRPPMLIDSDHDHERKLESGDCLKASKRQLFLFLLPDGNLSFYPNKEMSPH